jgi:hypothetical protein
LRSIAEVLSHRAVSVQRRAIGMLDVVSFFLP